MEILKVKIGDTTYYGKEELTLREQVTELQSMGIDNITLLAAYKTVKLNQLAENRWRAEVSGTTWNTYPVHTDRESQGKVTAAFVMATNGLWSGKWKFADGIARDMTATQIQELTGAVIGHVQTSYETEAVKIDAINAATDYAAVDAVDITF